MLKIGSVIKVVITGIQPYGAFCKYKMYDGLIHISEFSDGYVKSIKDYVEVDQIVKVQVVEIDLDNKQLRLSFKAVNKEKKLQQKNEIPELKIGFDSLDEKMNTWINKKYQDIKGDDKVE